MRVAVYIEEEIEPSLSGSTGALPPPAPWGLPAASSRAALEAALALVGAAGGYVAAVGVERARCGRALAWSLARGAGAALALEPPGGRPADPWRTAAIVAAHLRVYPADLLCCGSDGAGVGSEELPYLLARLLCWPVVGAAVELGSPRGGELDVLCTLEHGDRERVRVRLPAVVAVAAGAFPNRYVSFHARAVRGRLPATLPLAAGAPAAGADERLQLVAVEPLRPRARRTAAAPAGRSAGERLAAALGARQARTEAEFVEGDPKQVATAVISFLKARGFLDEREEGRDG